jgi:hypothetical protein
MKSYKQESNIEKKHVKKPFHAEIELLWSENNISLAANQHLMHYASAIFLNSTDFTSKSKS